MSASTSGLKLSFGLPGRLYVATTAPSTVGMCSSSLGACLSCSSVIGPSEAPKSTVREEICLIPPPLPIDW